MINLVKFKDLFVLEAKDHLQNLNNNLLLLEKQPGNKKIMDELMRSAHTIKSSSATMGYKKIAFLTHVIEDVFDYARNDILKITPQIIDESFKALDALEESVKSIKKTNKELSINTIADKIKKITGVGTEGVGKSKRLDDDKPFMKNQLAKNTTNVKKLENKEKNIKEKQKIDYIKVPVERLDNLMGLMEGLLIGKLRLERLKKGSAELEDVVDRLGRIISDVQYHVMQARLVPVGQIFAMFPRMVRDLAKEENKKVELEIIGSEMELDRTIIDKLGEPLSHLLRNAIDHGIEKSGVIKLQAKQKKESALIVVEDNGKGIDFRKVRQVAVKKGIISEKDIGAFNQNQITDLLYNSRLSTKNKVTETSGRGVGLSVVKNFVENIGGHIILESPISNKKGTRFTLELPLTLAIINALLVRANSSLFAIPLSNIARLVEISPDNIKSMADQDVAVVEGRDVPLVYLDKFFGLKVTGKKEQSSQKELAKRFLTTVLLKYEKDLAGVVVDELINDQEIMVKPLPQVLRKTKGFSGSTILGDGRTILILDTLSLLENTSKLVRTN